LFTSFNHQRRQLNGKECNSEIRRPTIKIQTREEQQQKETSDFFRMQKAARDILSGRRTLLRWLSLPSIQLWIYLMRQTKQIDKAQAIPLCKATIEDIESETSFQLRRFGQKMP